MHQDIRWRQRFDNLQKTFILLDEALRILQPSITERMGIIQAFEMCFELSWKTLKDYLQEKGFQDSTPRDVLKRAFQEGIIQEGELWLRALESRNETVHIYDQEKAIEIETQVREKYFPLIKQLHEFFLGAS